MNAKRFRRQPTVEIQSLLNHRHPLKVTWLGGLKVNLRDRTAPLAIVWFQPLEKEGSSRSSTALIPVEVPLATLGLFRIGSIWQNGSRIRLETTEYVHRTFRVDFTPDSWHFTSNHQARVLGVPPPIPEQDYSLRYRNDRNWLLHFKLPEGRALLVPCLEFFIRYYGRSAYIRNSLTTLPWNDFEERFFAKMQFRPTPDAWPLNVTPHARNDDALFLAHLLHDATALNAAQSIYAQAESGYSARRDNPVFLKVKPWFSGKTQLKVYGLPLTDRTFLALGILGGGEPAGPDVLFSRMDELANHVPTTEADEPTHRMGYTPPKTAQLIDFGPPDATLRELELHEPPFEILGASNRIRRQSRIRDVKVLTRASTQLDHEMVSTGTPYGSNKDIRPAHIHSPIGQELDTLPASDFLLQIWQALTFLARSTHSPIQDAAWYAPPNELHRTSVPALIPIAAFPSQTQPPPGTRNWPFIHTASRQPRGIMVLRAVINTQPIYLLEIQRRQSTRMESIESYMGLALAPPSDAEFNTWLPAFLSEIPFVKGIVNKLTPFPYPSKAFKHTTNAKDRVPYEKAISNAIAETIRHTN